MRRCGRGAWISGLAESGLYRLFFAALRSARFLSEEG